MTLRAAMLKPTARLWRAVSVVALPFLCTSCFTMGLWGVLPDSEVDAFTHQEETVFAYDEGTEWSWSLLGLRILLTPVTVGLDVLTCPVQAVLFGNDDDDC